MTRDRNPLLLAALLLAAPALPALAGGEPGLVGTWRFEREVDTRADGTVVALGPEKGYDGQLIYTADGHMAVEILPRGRTWKLDTATLPELRATFLDGTAYAGRYEVDPERHTVTHVPAVILEPGDEKSRLTRHYELAGDTLTLSGTFPYQGETYRFAITWKRLAATAGPAAAPGEDHGAMAAASGVTRADGGADPRAARVLPLRPMAGDVEILLGDPDQPGPFVMRIHELPGAIVPPHTHPVDENITVVQGTWYFGLGEEFDRGKLQAIPAGGYAFAPRGSSMFAYSPEGAIVQVHGVGPFHIHWRGGLHTLDDPDAATVFHRARGAAVRTPRGDGRIVQGYASGKILQYEIETTGGAHVMASDPEIEPLPVP